MLSSGSDDPGNFTIILHPGHNRAVVDVRVIRSRVGRAFVGLVVTAKEKIIVLLSEGLRDGHDCGHALVLGVPPDGAVTLVETHDATLTTVSTDHVKGGLGLGVGHDEVWLFHVE